MNRFFLSSILVFMFVTYSNHAKAVPISFIAPITGAWIIVNYLGSFITDVIVFRSSENQRDDDPPLRQLSAASWGVQLASFVTAIGLGIKKYECESGIVIALGTTAAYVTSTTADFLIFILHAVKPRR